MTGEDELFAFLDDLEGRSEAAYDAERAPELDDRARSEYGEVPLAARLMATVGDEVVLHVRGVGPLAGTLDRVAQGWCLLIVGDQEWVVRLAALAAIDGASDRAVPEVAWSSLARLGLGSALRRLADAGERCVVHRTDGVRHDGVVRRVGQDFAELVAGDPPRITLVAHAAIAAVQHRST